MTISAPIQLGKEAGSAAHIVTKGNRPDAWHGFAYRIAGLNLLAAIIIYWNTGRLGEAFAGAGVSDCRCRPHCSYTSHLSDGHTSS